jgi:hypothetical protein
MVPIPVMNIRRRMNPKSNGRPRRVDPPSRFPTPEDPQVPVQEVFEMIPRLSLPRMYRLILALVAGVLTFLAPPAPAQGPDEAAPEVTVIPATRAGNQLVWVLKVLNGQEMGDLSEHFSDTYLRLKEAEIKELLTGLRGEVFEGKKIVVNKILDAEREMDIAAEITAKNTWRYLHVFLILDDKTGKIAGLRFAPAGGLGRNISTWADLAQSAGRLGGDVAMGVYEVVRQNPRDGASPLTLRVITEVDADERLNIGTAFGMYVLGAVAERVGAEQAKWTDQVALKAEHLSLPESDLNDQPMGTTYSLATLSERMFSLDDNTAMDMLMDFVGRDAVRSWMATIHLDPARNDPILSSAELFKLKSSDELLVRYAAAGEAVRRELLAQVAELSLPDEEDLDRPREVSRVGWFATASECSRAMVELHKLERRPGMEPLSAAMRRYRGLRLDRDLWPEVAFKGGSEPGVLCLTWLLERDDGKKFVFSLIWNHQEKTVNEGRLNDVARSILRHLADEARE